MVCRVAVVVALAAAQVKAQTYTYIDTSGAGNTGPSGWATIPTEPGGAEPAYPKCGTAEQSPVNIKGVQRDNSLKPLAFSYASESSLRLTNNGIDITYTGFTASTVMDPNVGTTYQLNRVVVRTPSEHGIGGGKYDMEMQFINTRVNSDTSAPAYVAVAVLFTVGGAENTILNGHWENLPGMPAAPATSTNTTATDTNLGDLIIPGRYFTYAGGLTAPPCDEDVRWYIYKATNSLSQAQMTELQAKLVQDATQNPPFQNTNVAAPGLAVDGTTRFTGDAWGGFVQFEYGNNRPFQQLRDRVIREYDPVRINYPYYEDDSEAYDMALAGLVLACCAFGAFAVFVGLFSGKGGSGEDIEKSAEPIADGDEPPLEEGEHVSEMEEARDSQRPE